MSSRITNTLVKNAQREVRLTRVVLQSRVRGVLFEPSVGAVDAGLQ